MAKEYFKNALNEYDAVKANILKLRDQEWIEEIYKLDCIANDFNRATFIIHRKDLESLVSKMEASNGR